MVLEHIKDPASFHKHCFDLLKADGKAIHFFATLYNIASLTNYLLPDFFTQKLQNVFIKRNLYQQDKFSAYYHWCYGPTRKNIERFKTCGFIIESYFGFSGHNYFYKNKVLYWLEKKWSALLVKFQNALFCSNAIIILKRP